MPDLKDYARKRDFTRTGEPAAAKHAGRGPLTFVVQKHAARQLHYDLRLEVDGVLKSWAVPKGPSLDPAVKRLATMVEDHPLDYAGFEGEIPKGEYGGGQVIVWDRGDYSPDDGGTLLFDDRAKAEEAMRKGLQSGKISVALRGQKLKGSFTLVKTRRGEHDWLLIKHKDEFTRGDDILLEDRSVNSGRTIEDIKEGKDLAPASVDPADVSGAHEAPFPGVLPPMLASLADAPFDDPDWIFEPKLDGYRIIASVREGRARLHSRRSRDVTDTYGVLVPDLANQSHEMMLDGEIIALDEQGKPCFQCLQDYTMISRSARKGGGEPETPLLYYVFDLLYLDGYDLTSVPLMERKKLLRAALRTSNVIRLIDSYEKDGKTVMEAAIKNGFEGAMAKRKDSIYEPGRRSKYWLKLKARPTDDFVIGGYTRGEGNRADTFGALLLGHYDDKGDLIYAGHVGTGFDAKRLEEMTSRLDILRTRQCPFKEEPHVNAPAVWVKPELVAEVKFDERTKENLLRIPVFLRLRDDKPASEAKITDGIHARPTPDPPDDPQSANDILEQMEQAEDNATIGVDGHRIKVTNLDKTLWPQTDDHPIFGKRQLLIYLASVAPAMLPHMKDRPITMTRYPDGIHGERFYQKHWSQTLPSYVDRVTISSTEDGSRSEYLVCNSLATLLWLGQLADVEFHTWFSRMVAGPDRREKFAGKDPDGILDYPDFIIFDLDPYLYSGKEKQGDEPALNRKGFERVCEVALWLKEILDGLSLSAYVKTSGKTGLHVHVPIVRNLTYAQVRRAAETIGRALVGKHPNDITMDWAVEKRTGKIFFDYNQNVRGKTLACAYSPRPTPGAAVSTPLQWEELGKVYPTDFTITNVPERLSKIGDSWKDILGSKKDIRVILGIKESNI